MTKTVARDPSPFLLVFSFILASCGGGENGLDSSPSNGDTKVDGGGGSAGGSARDVRVPDTARASDLAAEPDVLALLDAPAQRDLAAAVDAAPEETAPALLDAPAQRDLAAAVDAAPEETAPPLLDAPAQRDVALAQDGAEPAKDARPIDAPAGVDAAPSIDAGGPACIKPPSGLVAWWPAEGNANDVVGGNNGSFAGAYVAGLAGKAFSVSATDFVSIPTSAALTPATAMSVEVWFMRSTTSGDADPVVKKGGEGSETCENCSPATEVDGYTIEFGSAAAGNSRASLYACVYTAGTTSGGSAPGGECTQPGAPVTNNTWTHAVSSYDGSSVKLYVNGTLAGSAAAPGAIVPSGNPLQLGRDPSNPNTRSFQGAIDEVSIYSRALSDTEVRALYAAGSAGKCAAGPQ